MTAPTTTFMLFVSPRTGRVSLYPYGTCESLLTFPDEATAQRFLDNCRAVRMSGTGINGTYRMEIVPEPEEETNV